MCSQKSRQISPGSSRSAGSTVSRRYPGNPPVSGGAIIEGDLAWLDCTIEAEHLAGDHLVVIGRVHACEAFAMRRPLLFFRGAFGVERPEDEEE